MKDDNKKNQTSPTGYAIDDIAIWGIFFAMPIVGLLTVIVENLA